MELTREAFLEGQILLIDKPLGWSSFQALNAVKWTIRRAFGLKKIKVGHAGTLDPLATGLLLLCTGKATKRISELQGLEKEYQATMVLGYTTPSYDLETEPEPFGSTAGITREQVEAVAKAFTGEIRQKPPVFSAIKKDGKRLYEYARKGQEVEIPERVVQISRLDIDRMEGAEVAFTVSCSKGTYIRSLAHDMGQALGCGAYLSALKRTKTGGFCVDNALTPDDLKALFREAGFEV
ncbi:tRNA pseudouridine(55) synthase TruB [Robiginitalea sediminis]|uniref:tRNA pseudouridine(55) synthase TruB n=1 Tax=Robiginitalea sediminis TaxID=1982593 RepID=UPI000B4BA7F8|nr:tRNA pseudouridine(55) synthase TruB [Robiginitalea sediminis]